MPRYLLPQKYSLQDLPKFKRFQDVNPQKILDEKSANGMYCHAIHWLSILQILWPNFKEINYYGIEVGYIVVNDPENDSLPDEFFSQIAETLATFWRIQLEDLYPNGDWEVEIYDDPEISVQATIFNRTGKKNDGNDNQQLN